jgi:hypothetical protein
MQRSQPGARQPVDEAEEEKVEPRGALAADGLRERDLTNSLDCHMNPISCRAPGPEDRLGGKILAR